jgi:hypothetical protein
VFGYIRPDEPYLYKKDEVLYNAVYCGLCKSIGNETEINNIIDSLYKLKDILNNIHEEK